MELASAILRDTPALITTVRGELPLEFARLVRRCLEKDPRDRIQTARDVANHCRALAREAAPSSNAMPVAPRRSIGSESGAVRQEGFRVAVLPFKARGTDAALGALAEGLTDEIITGLSRFTHLRVIARGSTIKYPDESHDIRAISRELSARYVIEGTLRQAGANCHLAVPLVDADSGANLQAETFDQPFCADDLFTLQAELVPRIVSTVADQHGVLVHSMGTLMRNKRDEKLTSHEATLAVFGFHERMRTKRAPRPCSPTAPSWLRVAPRTAPSTARKCTTPRPERSR